MCNGQFISSKQVLKYKKLVEDAHEPFRATKNSAGFDLYATGIEENGKCIKYHTGIAVKIPDGCCGFIMPRSSVVKTGMSLGNSVGLIDADYTGELLVVFYADEKCTKYKVGERIAQLVILPVPQITFTEVSALDETARGEGGFGSTGK